MVPDTVEVRTFRAHHGLDDVAIVMAHGLLERERAYDWSAHPWDDRSVRIASGSIDARDLRGEDEGREVQRVVEDVIQRALADPRVRARLELARRRARLGMRLLPGGRRDESGQGSRGATGRTWRRGAR